ncbi:MAG: flavin monoamine oxidase family protein, partial [Actinomycetes bacterium]
GLAGLCAARDLEAAGHSVVVLEARNRVGGRLLNHPIAGSNHVVEVGGQWVGPSQTRMLALAESMEVGTYPTHAVGEHLVDWDGRLIRYTGSIPRINPAVLADVGQAQARLERMARAVDPAAPWQTPKAERWDSQTFATWIARNTVTKGAATLLEIACEAVWACEPADVSLLHILFYTAAAGSFEELIGTEGGAQQDRFVGGSQLVAQRLAERLAGPVVLEAPVRRVDHDASGVTVHADGHQVSAHAAVVALPPALTARIDWRPGLPAQRDQLAQRMPQGTVAKCMAVYERPFWREQGLSGQAISVAGPTRILFDNSPPDGSRGVLLGFLEGRAARELGEWDAAARRNAVVSGFTRVFGSEAAEPLEYIEQRWAEEEWSRGCYGCYLPPGAWTAHGQWLSRPIGRIHWAGAETATVWAGYMDGAVRSGERAAAAVANQLAA